MNRLQTKSTTQTIGKGIGSRQFDCGPGLRLDAHESITALQFRQIESRMARIEELIERVDRRVWLAVFGVVAVFLTDAVGGIIVANL